MSGFDAYPFTADGKTRCVFVRGGGRPVLLLHELPGLYEADIALARRLADEKGFRVHVPLLFSRPGVNLHLWGYFPACEFGGPFSCVNGEIPNPINAWLLSLTRHIGAREGKTGVIGMCLTGSVPLTLLRADTVQAIVLAQPTIPFKRFPWNRSALGIPRDDLQLALKLAGERRISVYLTRFQHDSISSAKSFDRLADLLGHTPGVHLECNVLDAKGTPHSVFGHELLHQTAGTEQAFQSMTTLLSEALGPA